MDRCIVLRGGRQFVVRPDDDRMRVGVQLDPVAIMRRCTEDDLVRAIVSDGEVAIISVAEEWAGHPAVHCLPVHRERGVALLADPAAHAVRTVAANPGEVVDRIRIVALQFAGG